MIPEKGQGTQSKLIDGFGSQVFQAQFSYYKNTHETFNIQVKRKRAIKKVQSSPAALNNSHQQAPPMALPLYNIVKVTYRNFYVSLHGF
jgi:hypothetical protein